MVGMEEAGCWFEMLKYVLYDKSLILIYDMHSCMAAILAFSFNICNLAMLSQDEKCRLLFVFAVLWIYKHVVFDLLDDEVDELNYWLWYTVRITG